MTPAPAEYLLQPGLPLGVHQVQYEPTPNTPGLGMNSTHITQVEDDHSSHSEETQTKSRVESNERPSQLQGAESRSPASHVTSPMDHTTLAVHTTPPEAHTTTPPNHGNTPTAAESPQGLTASSASAQGSEQQQDRDLPFPIQETPSIEDLRNVQGGEGGVGVPIQAIDSENQHHAINETGSFEPYWTDVSSDFERSRQHEQSRPLPNGVPRHNHLVVNDLFRGPSQLTVLDNGHPARTREDSSSSSSSASSDEETS